MQLVLDLFVAEVLDHAATTARIPTGRPRDRWCAQHHAQAVELATRWPRAPAQMLAARLLGQPTPHLTHYR